jgi:hypothetical protein
MAGYGFYLFKGIVNREWIRMRDNSLHINLQNENNEHYVGNHGFGFAFTILHYNQTYIEYWEDFYDMNVIEVTYYYNTTTDKYIEERRNIPYHR